MELNSSSTSSQDETQSLLKGKSLVILLVLFLLAKLFLAIFSNSHETLASDLSADNILRAVNEQRSLRNLVTLNTNAKLGSAAQSKADDMQARHYFAHVDPEGHYIWDKIIAAGYAPFLQLGENLAIEFYDTDSLIAAWLNSPTHRANLLNEGFRDQGMGLAFGDAAAGQYHSAVANTFGTLALAQAPKPVATAPSAPQVTALASPKPKTLGTKKIAPTRLKPLTAPPPSTAVLPATTTKPTTTSVVAGQAIAPRSTELALAQSPQNDFTLPSKQSASATPNSSSSTQAAFGIVGNQNITAPADYQANRYLILIAGLVLLLLVLSDIKSAVEKRLGGLDKKTNNLVVLIISLIVIAFMYWF